MKPLFIPKEIVEKLNEVHEKYTRSKLGLVEKPIVGSKDWYKDLADRQNETIKALNEKLKSIQELCVSSRGEIHYYVDDFIESIEEILEK